MRQKKTETYRFTTVGWFIRVVKAIVKPVLTRRYNIRVQNPELIQDIAPPYFLMPNHMNTFDPFIISGFYPHHVHYVAADTNFRSPFIRFLLSKVGTIPKTKGMSDLDAIKNMVKVIKAGGVVGIFPEGERTWDGATMPVIPATAKMVRMLKVPVIVPILKGAYLSLPRWSRYRRKGQITIEYRIALTEEEAATFSTDQILKKLQSTIDFNEFDYNAEAQIPFRSRKKAMHLEHAIFICPECRLISSLVSKGNTFSCTACGYGVTMNKYGFFERESGQTVHFDTVHKWNTWQLNHLSEYLNNSVQSRIEHHLFKDENILCLTGYKREKNEPLGRGEAYLYPDRLEIVLDEGQTFRFDISDIDGDHVVFRDQFEFYHRGIMYRFFFKGRPTSGIKWHYAISMLKDILKKEKRVIEDDSDNRQAAD